MVPFLSFADVLTGTKKLCPSSLHPHSPSSPSGDPLPPLSLLLPPRSLQVRPFQKWLGGGFPSYGTFLRLVTWISALPPISSSFTIKETTALLSGHLHRSERRGCGGNVSRAGCSTSMCEGSYVSQHVHLHTSLNMQLLQFLFFPVSTPVIKSSVPTWTLSGSKIVSFTQTHKHRKRICRETEASLSSSAVTAGMMKVWSTEAASLCSHLVVNFLITFLWIF